MIALRIVLLNRLYQPTISSGMDLRFDGLLLDRKLDPFRRRLLRLTSELRLPDQRKWNTREYLFVIFENIFQNPTTYMEIRKHTRQILNSTSNTIVESHD